MTTASNTSNKRLSKVSYRTSFIFVLSNRARRWKPPNASVIAMTRKTIMRFVIKKRHVKFGILPAEDINKPLKIVSAADKSDALNKTHPRHTKSAVLLT